MTAKERARLIAARVCFNCKQLGYMFLDCPDQKLSSKNINKTPNVKVLEKYKS